MKVEDADALMSYLKQEADSLATKIEQPIATMADGAPDPKEVEGLAKICCELANHKLAVEMLEEYCKAIAAVAGGFVDDEMLEVENHKYDPIGRAIDG